ncbi:MAG TPA: hypothetical protein VNQ99_01255 [Xanthobacteraceae bacterium]|nr:hypothetical protein [Xanthobacteraceae bacterium]
MRAFFIECSGEHWVGVGEALATARGWEPVLWTGDADTRRLVSEVFLDCAVLVGVDETRNAGPAVAPELPLDGPLLRALAADEAIGLAMMDRMDHAPSVLSHDTRRRHWYALLRRWNGILNALTPDIVVFSIAPHAIYDYALYALCKHHGIETRMFERSALPGLVHIIHRFEEGSPQIRTALELGESSISARGQQHLAGLRSGGGGAVPENYRKKLAERKLLRGNGGQMRSGLLRIIGLELRRTAYLLRHRRPPQNYMLREDAAGRLVAPGLFGWLAARWRGQWRKLCLARLHQRLAQEVDLRGPFVLLALHFQPERAVVPMAGIFCDQLLIADMIARNLPNGWRLVVKEHPWQLVPFGRGELGRQPGFYREIAEMPNTMLAPLNADTQELLRHARAVVTVTGSVGWQAIACGIPALVFGAAWYRDADGVHGIDDLDSCRAALARIANGEGPAVGAAERMIAALEQVAVPGVLEPSLEAADHLDLRSAVAAMADALAASARPTTPYGLTAS